MGGGNEPKEDKKPIMPLGRLKKTCGLIIGWLIDVGRRLFLEHLQKSENPDLPTHRSGSDWIDWIGFFIPFWKDTPEETDP